MTLADLIDQHRANEAARDEAVANYDRSLAILRRAFEVTHRSVNHDEKQWFIYREDGTLWHSAIYKQPYPVPDARDVVVPAEVLEGPGPGEEV